MGKNTVLDSRVKTIENLHPYFYSETLGSSLKFHHPHALEVSFLSSCLEASWSCDDKPCTFISALVWYIIKSLGKSYGLKYHTAILLAVKAHHQNTQAKLSTKVQLIYQHVSFHKQFLGWTIKHLENFHAGKASIGPFSGKPSTLGETKFEWGPISSTKSQLKNVYMIHLGLLNLQFGYDFPLSVDFSSRRLSSCRYFRMNCRF